MSQSFTVDKDVRLPFDNLRQSAILGHCIRDYTFFMHCRTKILPEWFNDIQQGMVFKALLNLHKELRRKLTKAELEGSSTIMMEGPAERKALLATINKAWVAADEFGVDILRKELTSWYHARLYREGSDAAQGAYNQGDFNKAYAVMAEKMDLIRTATFEDDKAVSFDNPETYLLEGEKSYGNGLQTGLGLLDACLTTDGTPTAGLYRGDTTVILAPSNTGKTSTMITMAMYNILNGKDVLFLTHEGRASDIREKFLMCALQKTRPQLFAMYKTPEGVETIGKVTSFIHRHLVYIPYNKAGMTVEEVGAVIRRRQEERVAKSPEGKGFDMLVDDYPAKLTTEKAARGNLPKRNADSVVYDYFVQFALEYDWHSLVAIQTNRQGSRDNRDAERLLTMEDVSESWDVMTMATNVLTLNRSPDDVAQNRLTFYVAKSRSSETGKAVVARSNYAVCRTHSDKMGAVWYRGEQTLTGQIEQFFKIRNNQELTANDLKAVGAA